MASEELVLEIQKLVWGQRSSDFEGQHDHGPVADTFLAPISAGPNQTARGSRGDIDFLERRFWKEAEKAVRARNFYRENPSRFVMERSEIEIMDGMAGSAFYEITAQLPNGGLATDGQSTNIVAAFMKFDHNLPIRTGDRAIIRTYTEFGTMLSRMSGFRLQEYAHAIRQIEHLSNGETAIPFAATYSDNVNSIDNLLKNCGYLEQPICPEFHALRTHQLDVHKQGDRMFRTFRLPVSAMVHAAKALHELKTNPTQSRSVSRGRRGYIGVSRVHFRFGPGFRPDFFDTAKGIAEGNPKSMPELAAILGRDKNYFPPDYVASV